MNGFFAQSMFQASDGPHSWTGLRNLSKKEQGDDLILLFKLIYRAPKHNLKIVKKEIAW